MTLVFLLGAGQANAALDVSMSISPTYQNPIYPGDITSFRITVTNSNSGAPTTNVAFTNTMPVAITVAGAGLTSYTCTDGDGNNVATQGAVTATVGSNVISLAGGSVPAAKPSGASGKCDIDVEVTSTVKNQVHTNTIPAGGVTGNDGAAVQNGTQAQQSITVNDLNAPSISKSFSASTVVKTDQTVKLTITISNANNLTKDLPLNGAGDTPAFAIRDVLPSGLQVAGTPAATSNCSAGGTAPAFAPSAGDTTLTATGGTVAAGGTCTLTIDLVGTDTNNTYSKSVTNTISRTADFGNKRGLVPSSDATANLQILSLLRVTEAFSPTTVAAGQQATLTITLTNASPISTLTLTNYSDNQIDDDTNAGFGLVVNNVATTCTGATASAINGNAGISLTNGTIAPSSSCTITVTYTGSVETTGVPKAFTNAIAAGDFGTTDASIFSQAASHSVTVVDQLTIGKAVTPTTVAPGNPVRYTITVNNYSVAALSNVQITDALPGGMVALPSSPAAPALSGTGCVGLTHDIPALPATTTTPHFTIGTFPAGTGPSPATCTVTFWAMPPTNAATGTQFNNSLGAGSVRNDGGTGGIANNGSASSGNTTIASSATVGKIFSPASTFEGTISQLTVTFTNITAQTVTNASFTDNLPIGSTGLQLVVADPANASSTCAGATVTATPGASSVSMTGATIPARASNGTGANGSCTLKVNVIGAAGNYTNSLPAGALSGTQTYADGTTATVNSPGPVTASLTYSSALTSGKSFSPATINSGGKSTVTVQLGNAGSGTLNNVSVTDPLPAGMVLASPPNTYTTCGGTPAITAAAGANSISMTGAVIPASGNCNFLFDVTATGGGNWVNTIPAGNITATGGVQNVAAVTATLNNSSAGTVSVTNNTNPNSLTAPGEVSLLTINISNTGTVTLNNLSLTDYFTDNGTAGGAATGMVLSTSPSAATTCPGGVVTASADGTSVSLSGATLAAGNSCTVTANVTLRTTGTVQNTIPVGAISTSQGISNTTLTVTSLSAGANIGVTKRFLPTVIKPGERSRLRLTFIHPVALPLTNLAATDNLPAGLTVPAGANPTTTCTGASFTAPTATSVTLSGGSLPAASGGVASTCYAEIDVTAAVAGTYVNTVAIGGVTGTIGGGSANNPVAASATLEVRNPVTITKAFNPQQVSPGTPSALTITLTNPNSIALTNAVLQDNLPTNLTVALTPNASTTCGGVVTAAASATSVVLTGGTIPANGSCNVKVDTVSNISGIYVNTIPAGNLATQQGVTNEDPATDTLRVLEPPTVSKQFSPTSIPSGGTSKLTIVLGNSNSSATTLTSNLVDTLPTSPGPIVVAATPNVVKTCPGTVTATAGSGTVTYANGSQIPAGGCTISVDVTGTTNGVHANFIPAGDLKTTFGNSIQPANANLTISPLGFIAGKVFKDNNVTPNGTYEQGTDTPISGVTVTLTGTDYGANGVAGGGDDVAVNLTTTTDALGNYAFTSLNPGSYTVSEPTQPTGTSNGITTAAAVAGAGGGTAGTATGTAVVPSTISNIILLKDGTGVVSTSSNNNFAEVVPSSISGTVFLDQNDNGTQNAADTAISGVGIDLLNAANAVVASTTTDASGNYSFTGLAPGTYSVREPAQPANTANGKAIAGAVGNGGTAGTATLQTVVPSAITGITLPPNTSSTGNNFAEVPAGRQVSGRVFIDFNNDGVFNGSDTGIGSYSLTLTGTDFNGLAVNQTATTSSDGRYVFSGLAAGTYSVTEPTQPSGTLNGLTIAGSTGGIASAVAVVPSTITGVDLTGTNTISSDNNFAEVPAPAPPTTASIAGRVYIDANDNGTLDSSETGIAGVLVRLTGTSSASAPVDVTVSTSADGSYIFTGLLPSNGNGYTINETQPAAYTDGKTTVGGNGNGIATSLKPVAAGNTDVIGKIVLNAGNQLTGYNFGEKSAGNTLSGFVYVDANDNGIKEGDEKGINGVTVRLTGTTASGDTVSVITTTAADGSYSFTNLQPSNAAGYTITEIQPSVYADGRTSIASGNPGAAKVGKPLAGGGSDTIEGVVVANGSTLTNYNFGEKSVTNMISGFVYADKNDNGVKDDGEDGIAKVVLTLTGTDVNGNAVKLTTISGSDGRFGFINLKPSNDAGYTIVETQPPGYRDGKTTVVSGNPGKPDSKKPAGVGNIDRISGVTLKEGVSLDGYLFGELPVPQLKPPIVNGYVWLDRSHNRVRPLDGSQQGMPGWTVQLKQNGTLICTTHTDDNGFYQFDNLHCPGYEISGLPTGTGFSISFSKDGSNLPAVPMSGGNRGEVPSTGGQINNITLHPSDQVVEQNLPLDPAGVVYDSITRRPVRGASVTISGPPGFNPEVHLVGSTAAHTQAVGDDGMYQFLLQNDFPTGVYTLTVVAPAGYLPAPSTRLPACNGAPVVGLFPTPALVQASDTAPALSVTQQLDPAGCAGMVPGGALTTQYYFGFHITNGGSAPILNNHIPLDPVGAGSLVVTKTTPMVNVARGDLVPYTITVTNIDTRNFTGVGVRDQMPPGFKYRAGSARRNGVPVEPTVNGRVLTWPAQSFVPQERHTYTLVLAVGAGVGDGDYVNQAFAVNGGGGVMSNVATATVRIVPDATFDCPDIIGKVFDDANANGYQDQDEPGIPAVRVVTPRGLLVTTDSDGRFHVPCADIPNADRGSNFVMKLDERTLPSGYRVTTENPRDVRVTRGKLVKLNFGATIHRVVRIELNGSAFETDKGILRPEWNKQIDNMIEQLKTRPSVVRIAYRRDGESESLASGRVNALRDDLHRRWRELDGKYTLVIEAEDAQ
ncbi:MAG TPA: SdrD B-like domain-containing protein [Noviherbaspirillum sp.]|nr:SdrD B-like domain-containing protein [Noviherbaspirillum sp.]